MNGSDEPAPPTRPQHRRARSTHTMVATRTCSIVGRAHPSGESSATAGVLDGGGGDTGTAVTYLSGSKKTGTHR